MTRLLLISNSTLHGSGYLDHCMDTLRDFLGPAVERVTFVPYALDDRDGYARVFRERLGRVGLEVISVHGPGDADGARAIIAESQAVFVGGGNTFRLVDELQTTGVLEAIRVRVAEGMPYVGSSAGTNVACPTIMTTNDMPIVQPASFEALGLVPFQINAHFIDTDPDSTHMGETREQRIHEFHEMNDAPVLGLREGTLLRVEAKHAELVGDRGGRLFRRGRRPEEIAAGARVDELLG